MKKIIEFFKKYYRDIVIIFGVAVCSISTIFIVRCATSKNAVSATIYQQNQVISTIDLSKESENVREIQFPKDDVHLVIGVKKNAICVLSSDCPHQDCVNMGWITSSSRPIICAHYKVSIEISGSSDLDVEIG